VPVWPQLVPVWPPLAWAMFSAAAELLGLLAFVVAMILLFVV
jgi:hypothetical protein